jgi:uncharacterized coiled-coil protein SlyX
VERIRQNSDSRDRDYRSRDDYPEMSRDDYRDGGQEDFRNVPTSDFPLLTDKSHASAISYDEMLREITQLKHAFTQQQTKISTLELKVTSLSKASESSQQTNTDRFSSLEVTLGSVTRQRGHDGPSAETGNLLRSVTSRIDGLDAAVSRLMEDQVPKEMISQITKSIVTSSKQLDQVVNEVRDMSSRALKSSESVVSAILSQGDNHREYSSPRR